MTKLMSKAQKNISVRQVKLFIVMGVSGSGKTAVAEKLAKDLNKQAAFEFLDADDFHSPQAKQRMADNLPLDDTMRKPWIAAIMDKLVQLNSQKKNVVLAYSGLKQHHRDCFRTLAYQCHYYYLKADSDIIRTRMLSRKDHFFSVALLESQFSAMQAIDCDEKDITEIDASTSFNKVYKKVFMLAQKELAQESAHE